MTTKKPKRGSTMETSYYGFEGRTPRYVASQIGLRSCLPYGKWTCDDGTEYLFNRGYGPIFKRRDGRVELVNPGTWVHGIHKQVWYYDDATAPYAPCTNSKSLRRCLDVLSEWGMLEVNAYSRLSDAGKNVPVTAGFRLIKRGE